MALTAREWLLLPKDEQEVRGKELSMEECRKLRMELSEVHFTEEEKLQMTEEEKEKNSRSQFFVMQEFGLLPKNISWEEWRNRGFPLNWR